MKKVDKSKGCHCGSSKTYGEYYWNKDFEFHIEDSGETTKAIKINEELRKYLDRQLQTYQDIFNREPLPDEPVYLWSLVHADEDYDHNIEDHLLREGLKHPEFTEVISNEEISRILKIKNNTYDR